MASKAEVWGKHLAAYRANGLSTAAFCRDRGQCGRRTLTKQAA